MLSSSAGVRDYFIEFIGKLRQCCRNFLRVTGLVRIESEIRILWAGWRAGDLNLHTLPENGIMSFSIKHKLIIWILLLFFIILYSVSWNFTILCLVVGLSSFIIVLIWKCTSILEKVLALFLYQFPPFHFSLLFLNFMDWSPRPPPPQLSYSLPVLFSKTLPFCSILYKLSST